MPATLEEDDPFLGVGLLAQIETCMSSIIAKDTRVCQLDTFQGSIVIVFGITNSWMHHNIFALNQIVAIATIVVGNVAVAAIQWQ